MKTSRMVMYWTIAILTALSAMYILAQEPPPDWPINLVHLLTKYKY